ncbi:conserved hypothetical protein [Alkaliphilus metalliredigens QYMF]|uniref:Nucleoside recognition domain protein n=1 Tax=Alkaliphilus metalliredigens (strain QYMF) TaxID=293826 RepID=A6TWM2_ALKMQ|nr:hypothetical protein [Alkaliphilus metalliredigens]ABR50590.1 conserved hypothetical protein [Alkaliphilus metalliredigens QYMF]
MQHFIDLIMRSGESGVHLALYVLLPVLVVMMALMRLLEERGVLNKVAIRIAPLLLFFGIPGLGVFAILQILLVSFAAPIATLKIMSADDRISKAGIAATLAAVFTMSQGNAAFPMAVAGLNIPILMTTSVIGGLLAAYIAYRSVLKEGQEHIAEAASYKLKSQGDQTKKASVIQLLFKGGEEGLNIAIKSIPPLILSIFMVNILREVGAINLLETVLSPALTRIGIPGVAVLPVATKYLAGGTAMMAITLELVQEGAINALELNRIAGFILNPLDPVGVALLASAGSRVGSVTKPAIKGAFLGIIFRGILHLLIFKA